MADYEDKYKGGNAIPAITRNEHDPIVHAKQTIMVPMSYYKNASLASGYVFHGFAPPGTSLATPDFRIQRENLDVGHVLFAGGNSQFVHTWSGTSLASVSYS